MKVAFIGIGSVGGTLAKKIGSKGHSVYLGARNQGDAKAIQLAKDIGAQASILSPADAAEKADVILLATPWEATEAALKGLGSLAGKVLIDCTNPLKPALAGLTHGLTTSGGEHIQSLKPEAKVVKAFNTTGFNIMNDPAFAGAKAPMFFCGNDKNALETTRTLIADVGFEPIEAGDLTTARLLEPMALLWISSAYKFGLGREFAFGLLRR